MYFRRIKKFLKNTLIYFIIKSLITLIQTLPRPAALNLGGWLGAVAFLFPSRERKKTLDNLKSVWGEKSKREIYSLARQVFIELGKSAADAVCLKFWTDEDFRKNVWVEGLTRFDSAYKKGKGLVIVTGHLSNFELIPVYLSRLGYKGGVIGRQLYDPRLDRIVVDNRVTAGFENIPSDASPKTIMKLLQSGGGLGVLIDQNSSRVSNLEIEFFGRKANTPKGPFALACKVGCPVIPIAIVREKLNCYRILVGEELRTSSAAGENGQLTQLAQKANLFLEELIKQYPSQWVWMHKRWN